MSNLGVHGSNLTCSQTLLNWFSINNKLNNSSSHCYEFWHQPHISYQQHPVITLEVQANCLMLFPWPAYWQQVACPLQYATWSMSWNQFQCLQIINHHKNLHRNLNAKKVEWLCLLCARKQDTSSDTPLLLTYQTCFKRIHVSVLQCHNSIIHDWIDYFTSTTELQFLISNMVSASMSTFFHAILLQHSWGVTACLTF